jgi:hypothetical protein
MDMSLTTKNYKNLNTAEKYDAVLKRSEKRQEFLELIIKLMGVCELNGLRMIVENPWSMQTYLKNGFIKPPSLIDMDRSRRGDYFVKPTAYWFINCEPTHGMTLQKNYNTVRISSLPPVKGGGICNEGRSMISSDYARNFICDFIIGKPQNNTQLNLFD